MTAVAPAPKRVSKPRWPMMHALLAHGAAAPSRERLAELAGISDRTVTNLMKRLGPRSSHLLANSRPPSFGPGAGLALGLSVGSQNVRGGLVDANGNLHNEKEAEQLPEQLLSEPRVVLSRIRSIAAQVLEDALAEGTLCVPGERPGLALLGAIVAWPSPLDRSKRPGGRSLDPSWKEIASGCEEVPSIPERLAATLGEPFTVERCHAIHDVNAHALWLGFHESRQRTIDLEDESDMWRVALVLRVSEGLAASAMLMAPPNRNRLSFIDSKLIEGTKGFAGEIGHLHMDKRVIDKVNANTVTGLAPIDYERWTCSCGRRHHLEAFASARGLRERIEASKRPVPDSVGQKRLLDRAREGRLEDVDKQMGIDIGRILGHALAGPILMLDPSSITLTGPLANEAVVKGIEREGTEWASVIDDSVRIDIDRSGAGEYIGVRGAAMALVRQLVYRDFLDRRKDVTPAAFRVDAADVEALRGR